MQLRSGIIQYSEDKLKQLPSYTVKLITEFFRIRSTDLRPETMPRGPRRTRLVAQLSPLRADPAERRHTSASANLQPSCRPRTPTADNVKLETAPPPTADFSDPGASRARGAESPLLQANNSTPLPRIQRRLHRPKSPLRKYSPTYQVYTLNFVSGIIGTYRVNSYYTAPTTLLAACHSPACIGELHTALLSAYTFAGIAMASSNSVTWPDNT